MAIDEGSETTILNKRDRCRRFDVQVLDDDSVLFQFRRERVWSLSGVIQQRKVLTTTERTLTQIGAQSFVINSGLTITGSQLIAILNKVSDILRAEDIAAGLP
jgi:hypothetical protein